MVSGIFQDISGPNIVAAYAASNAEIARSLGRDLGSVRRQDTLHRDGNRSTRHARTMYDHRSGGWTCDSPSSFA